VDDERKCCVKLCDIWDNITFNTEYKELPFKEKRKYNRKYFDEWIEGKASVSAGQGYIKIIKGYKLRDESPVEDDRTDTEVL
jgi:hypothetical protein